MNYTKWSDEEVKTLFKFIEVKKSEGFPLIKIFALYAKSTHRCKNSVRNYYYKELACLNEDSLRAKNLNINLSNHSICKVKPFTKQEEIKLVEEIENLRNNGYTVRKACLTLSNGDVSKMIRLQNKYRSIIKENNKSTMGEIIKMPDTRDMLSDEDIKALFLGLVNLVKKQEYNNAKKNMEEQLNIANNKLRKAMNEIILKQQKIEHLKSQIELLQNQDVALKENKPKQMLKKSATEQLKNYFKTQQNQEKQAK